MADVIKLKVTDSDLVVKSKVDTVEEVIKEIEVPIPAEDVDRVLDRSATEISTGASVIGSYALAFSDKLTSIHGMSVERLENCALYMCGNLTTLDLPNLKNIETNSLYGCPLTTEITFPELIKLDSSSFNRSVVEIINVPKLTTLLGQNFTASKVKELKAPQLSDLPNLFMYRATQLQRAIFPNCNSVGNSAFDGCSNVEIIDLGHPLSIGGSAFDYVKCDVYIRTPTLCNMLRPTSNFRGRFLVPSELVDQYREADNWSAWADNIFAIEEG